MSKRISHSLLDPILTPPLKAVYNLLPIPRRFPPEGIILMGHLLAIAGAVGFAFATTHWWGGLLLALGVVGNHTADCIDGQHARATNQCRHGGELLDHFTDPLSFAYWMIGWGIAAQRIELAIVAVLVIYATAVLTNIRAKMTDQFTLSRFGPTEFKASLVLLGLTLSTLTANLIPTPWPTNQIALTLFAIATTLGVINLITDLTRSVKLVNRSSAPIDTSDWHQTAKPTPLLSDAGEGTPGPNPK